MRQGIELTCRLPAGEGRDRSELDFQLVLGPCLIATQGPAASTAVTTFTRARELCERLRPPPEYLQVLFWLATVNVVRGELPQALEAVEGMPSAAETRGNRGALLNVIRGRAMILMFMGTWRPERNSNAPSRCSAQARRPTDWPPGAAGQDADVAMLALAAWVFWILGQVDEAVRK